MKNLIIMLSALFLLGCSKDDDKKTDPVNNPTNTVQSTISNGMQNGTWVISNFNEDGKDETVNFNGYTFTFNQDGSLTASNGSITYVGTWSITDSNSSDDTPDDLHFNILFNETNDFEDLNDDWDILNYSDSKIELQDVSGGNGGIDLLTFSKK